MAEGRTAGVYQTAHEWTESQRRAIQDELDNLLAHSSFKSSRRSVELLQYLVQQALNGEQEGIKERTLGIEVFGRDASYDTNGDPIVRRTANEIRKRLALFYLESGRDSSVHIHLERGSYRALFEFAGEQSKDSGPSQPAPAPIYQEPAPQSVPGAEPEPAPIPRTLTNTWRTMLLAVAGGLVVLLALRLLFARNTHTPERNLWKPLVSATPVVTICLADLTPFLNADYADGSTPDQPGSAAKKAENFSRFSSDTPFSDVNVAHVLSNRLSTLYKVQTQLQLCSALKLQDLRKRPTVLLGGTNNPWVLLLLSRVSGARYSMETDPATKEVWIRDSTKPADQTWKSDGKPHDESVLTDYGLITRFVDQESGQWVLALSGLGAHGTEAAGLLSDDPSLAKLLPAQLPATGNVQIVIQTSVIRGTTSSIKVVAYHTW